MGGLKMGGLKLGVLKLGGLKMSGLKLGDLKLGGLKLGVCRHPRPLLTNLAPPAPRGRHGWNLPRSSDLAPPAPRGRHGWNLLRSSDLPRRRLRYGGMMWGACCAARRGVKRGGVKRGGECCAARRAHRRRTWHVTAMARRRVTKPSTQRSCRRARDETRRRGGGRWHCPAWLGSCCW